MFLDNKRGYVQDWITQQWVKYTGKRISPESYPWLMGPIGDVRLIKDQYIDTLRKKENLVLKENVPGSGLIEHTDQFGFTGDQKSTINAQILDFYTHTITYDLDFWSKWYGGYKFMGQLLSVIFSKRLQQLNIPLDPLESTKGIDSNILKLISDQENTKYTIWYRKVRSTGQVIYSGLYDTVFLDSIREHCIRVIFPLPNGNATVIMRKEVLPDGSLKLVSSGKKIGDPGFYFVLLKGSTYYTRFVRSVQELIHVYVDDNEQLRTDHQLKFYGSTVFGLHYKMMKRKDPPIGY
ncbi:hypothetical protein QQ008_04765 [Fulvivirgaceae bacterium BMA10]|uniref:Uncharacterized protein n=1 Tax=Splendidivirga corallicola TaxID=3051826 RepID=A0ABT8KIW9_9BACT|nr:hypothetical protein [Fulvivirgaceae bacterium BMA10]